MPANKNDCLTSRILAHTQRVLWLGVLDRGELPDFSRVKQPVALILNFNQKDKRCKHKLEIILLKDRPNIDV